jgi:hypothetical protein
MTLATHFERGVTHFERGVKSIANKIAQALSENVQRKAFRGSTCGRTCMLAGPHSMKFAALRSRMRCRLLCTCMRVHVCVGMRARVCVTSLCLHVHVHVHVRCVLAHARVCVFKQSTSSLLKFLYMHPSKTKGSDHPCIHLPDNTCVGSTSPWMTFRMEM